jgi:tripartite-type tricarboxylate transporter receptor subunit TctC
MVRWFRVGQFLEQCRRSVDWRHVLRPRETDTWGYEAAGWIGFGVPKGTPSEIIATLNKQTNAAVLDSNIKQRFADLGAMAVRANSSDEFAKFIAENIDKWTKVIKFAGIKPQ